MTFKQKADFLISNARLNSLTACYTKTSNFKPFCHVIKSVLLKREHINKSLKAFKSLCSNGFVVNTLTSESKRFRKAARHRSAESSEPRKPKVAKMKDQP